MRITKIVYFIIFNCFLIVNVFAQEEEIKIAKEYYSTGEFEKAKLTFEKLAKKEQNIIHIYEDYTNTLVSLKDLASLEKFVKKSAKSFPENVLYKLDHYVIVSEYFDKGDAEKEFKSIENSIKNDRYAVKTASDYLVKKNKPEKARDLYLASRKALGEKSLFAVEIATLHKMLGNEDLMIAELLEQLKLNPENLENIKNSLQNNITEKKGFEILENKLYELVQKDPDEISYNELLLWLNIQNKNFNKAFLQAKAIDKRNKTQGSKLFEVGKIALENRDYESAIRYFQSIITDYRNSPTYQLGRRYLIMAKEEMVKNTFPIDIVAVQSLINDYSNLIKEFGKNYGTFDALRNMALLNAFYLNKRDTATVLLNEAIVASGANNNLKARAKLDLGDIYLLKGEPWEATLLYSQVEKLQKDETLGHEAKLKNAKLSYYKGDFELAQAHLDVLKLATTREISNDAMFLSLLIQDNLALDTSGEALKEYADIDLLLFQNRNEEALMKLEAMEKKYAGHSLSDEILWLRAKIFKKSGLFKEALSCLETINSKYSSDILGDDALFMIAMIYEENLKETQKAMDLFQEFMVKFPGSIYTAEARKRFRKLRGDKI